MKFLKEKMPILYSPTFWGLTFTAVFSLLGYYEVADEYLLNVIATWLAGITGVNILWKFGNKVSGK